jgi:hypothetical protein
MGAARKEQAMHFRFDKTSAPGPGGQNVRLDNVLTKALFFNAGSCAFIEDSDGKLSGAALVLSVPQAHLMDMLWRPDERMRLAEILKLLPEAVHAVLVIRDRDIVAQLFSSGIEAKTTYHRVAAAAHYGVKQMQEAH